MSDTMQTIKVPTLLIHPTADTEIRRREAQTIYGSSGADDKTLIEITGALHSLERYGPEALNIAAEWLRKRFP